ncbi:MAG: hypothetical protein WBD05_00495 [Phycisphaerae bacterium]
MTPLCHLEGRADLDELYAYDDLNRLTTFYRGDLDGDKDEIVVADREYGEAWDLTPVGNWEDYQIDDNGDGDYVDASDLDQDRLHNLVNEIDGNRGKTLGVSPSSEARRVARAGGRRPSRLRLRRTHDQ